jgi:hypothetical protein
VRLPYPNIDRKISRGQAIAFDFTFAAFLASARDSPSGCSDDKPPRDSDIDGWFSRIKRMNCTDRSSVRLPYITIRLYPSHVVVCHHYPAQTFESPRCLIRKAVSKRRFGQGSDDKPPRDSDIDGWFSRIKRMNCTDRSSEHRSKDLTGSGHCI